MQLTLLVLTRKGCGRLFQFCRSSISTSLCRMPRRGRRLRSVCRCTACLPQCVPAAMIEASMFGQVHDAKIKLRRGMVLREVLPHRGSHPMVAPATCPDSSGIDGAVAWELDVQLRVIHHCKSTMASSFAEIMDVSRIRVSVGTTGTLHCVAVKQAPCQCSNSDFHHGSCVCISRCCNSSRAGSTSSRR